MTVILPFESLETWDSFEQHCHQHASDDLGASAGTTPVFASNGLRRSYDYWIANLASQVRLGREPFSSEWYLSSLGLLCVSLCHHPLVHFVEIPGAISELNARNRELLMMYPAQFFALDVVLMERLFCIAYFEGNDDPRETAALMRADNMERACRALQSSPNEGFDFLKYFEI